jgi:hypothetical protein
MTIENDIFNHLNSLGIKKEATIVGSGPNGAAHINQINTSSTLLALNGACQYDLNFDYWFCFDPDVCQHRWFNQYYQENYTKSVFSSKMLKMTQLSSLYTFKKDPNFGKHNVSNNLIYGTLRGGATIAGAALQACFFAGCKHITLVGVDMYGSQYFYKKINNKPQHKEWKQLSQLNQLIVKLKSHGLEITSLSETALEL